MYNHAPKNYICPFCLVVQGVENEHVYTRSTDIIYQDDSLTACISSHQWPHNHGHVIIFPNEHFENIYDLPDYYAARIQALARRIALAMKQTYNCHGISTRQHNEPAGNQDVWHYHFHVFPRYEEDNLYSTKREMMPIAKRAQFAQQLKMAIKNG